MESQREFCIRDSDSYKGKNVLAPMVRVGTLPMRMLAAEYGAHITYGEELVDKRMVHCRRVENPILGSVDFVDKADKLVFRTADEERGRVVFQVGTADAVTALKAAELVAGDVAAFDVNMGCPKHFSTSGGMGAALLHKPDTVRDILTTLRRNLSIPVTCKIRLLETTEKTLDLVRAIEQCGVTAMGLHARYIPQRPRDPAHWDLAAPIVEALSIPVIANGDVFQYEDFQRMRDSTGAASSMTARGAQWNASIFRPQGILPLAEVKKAYVQKSILWDNPVANSKYVLKEMIQTQGKGNGLEGPEGKAVNACKSMKDLAAAYDLSEYYAECVRARSNHDGNHVGSRKRPASPSTLTEDPGLAGPTGGSASLAGESSLLAPPAKQVCSEQGVVAQDVP